MYHSAQCAALWLACYSWFPSSHSLSALLLATEWSLLINKVQSWEPPIYYHNLPLHHALTVIASMPILCPKYSWQKLANLCSGFCSSVLSDFLVQMPSIKYSSSFMLTTASLNRIEHNDVKFKCINYGTGEGKKFFEWGFLLSRGSLNDLNWSGLTGSH